MAILFFSRTGTDAERADQGRAVPIATVIRSLGKHDSRFQQEPPIVNGDEKPSQYSAYTQTVIQVDHAEVCQEFPKAGYYWFPSVRPAECLVLLGLAEPPP